ncbi:MAG: DNA polymerase IV, partial [Lachnospiraceae bacterium]|nr:DNA polymerase IV [Lachnospiraceae bacterium]
RALEKCPSLIVIPPHHDLYHQYSLKFMNILREYTPIIEKFSVDEAYCDMTDYLREGEDPVLVAHHIKDRIFRELHFTVNVGVAPNKLLAKMASDFQKPNRVHTLFREEIPAKLWPLPVRDLFSVGGATAQKLLSLGIHTIGELAHADPSILKAHLKKQGAMIYAYANGYDDSPVSAADHLYKGYGNSTTTAFDVTDAQTARLILRSLSETVGSRLRRDHRNASVVTVEIKNQNFITRSHQCSLLSPTNVTDQIYETAATLFDQLWDGSPLRLLGVRATKLSEEETRQLNLFDMEQYDKLSKLDSAIDQIRNKYGKNSIMRASFLNEDRIDHMTGKKK